MKWNESSIRPLLCTYRLNWARRTSWGWWDDWDDTVLQTQDSKFEPWRSEAEHATSQSRRLPAILTFTRGWGRNILFLSNRRVREPNPVKGSGANHHPRAPAHFDLQSICHSHCWTQNISYSSKHWARILVQVMIYRSLRIGRDDHLDHHVSPLSILGHCLDVVFLGMLQLTAV